MLVRELIQYLQELPGNARIGISIDVAKHKFDLEKRAITTLFLNDHVSTTAGIALLFKGIIDEKNSHRGIPNGF